MEEPGEDVFDIFRSFRLLEVTEAVITGPSITANKPTRRQVSTNTNNLLRAQDPCHVDEDDGNDTNRAEEGNFRLTTKKRPNINRTTV